jgi:PST family polysaccharide transporter
MTASAYVAPRARARTTLQRALTLGSRDLGRKVISGAGFQFLGIVLRTILTIGSTAILARLLLPADFGYVAMATVVTELAALFANFGLTNILIQRKRITRLQVDTVFWASLGLGVVLSLVVLAMSLLGSWLFRDPLVGQLLSVLCWTFAIGSLTAIPWVLMVRLMRFRTEFTLQISTIVLRSAAAIACAAYGMGAWSLVVGALVGGALQALFGMLAVGYWPRLRFNASLLTSTWKTSGSYFGSGFSFYLNMNLDLILIGRQMGATTLGFYQGARSLTDEIRARIAIPLQHVLFPAFSAVQADKERMQAVVLRSGRLIAAAVMPIGIGLSVLAEDLVPVLYGARWSDMIVPLSLLGVSAGLRASTSIATVVINACDQVPRAFRYQLQGTALMAMGLLVSMPFGLVAVAAAQMIVSFYALVPFAFALKLIGLGRQAASQILGPPVIACAAMALTLMALRPLTEPALGAAGRLLVLHSLVCGGVYVAVLHLVSRQYLADLLDVVERLRRKER